jgi:hypothetical protein
LFKVAQNCSKLLKIARNISKILFQPKLGGVSELDARMQSQLQSDNFEQTKINTKTKAKTKTKK